MDNTPKKSKALIITFVIVFLLLLGGYFLIKNSEQVFGTKGATNINKIFSPLLGTSKKTALETIDTAGAGSTTTTGTGGVQAGTSGIAGQEGSLSGEFGSENGLGVGGEFSAGNTLSVNKGENSNKYSIPVPGNGSTFGLTGDTFTPDNTGGDYIDDKSKNGSDNTDNTDNTDDKNGSDNNNSDNTDNAIDTSVCAGQAQLVLKPEEIKRMQELLSQYYLIASELKTQNNVNTLEGDLSNSDSIKEQAISLASLCREQVDSSSYAGPKEQKIGNPYYQSAAYNISAKQNSGGSMDDFYAWATDYDTGLSSWEKMGTYIPYNGTYVEGRDDHESLDFGIFETLFKIW